MCPVIVDASSGIVHSRSTYVRLTAAVQKSTLSAWSTESVRSGSPMSGTSRLVTE